MRKVILGLWLLSTSSFSYNTTQLGQDLPWVLLPMTLYATPSGGVRDDAQFGIYFDVGTKKPILMASTLMIQRLVTGDQNARSVAFSMVNRAIAEGVKENLGRDTTLSDGYLIAAGVDLAAIAALTGRKGLGGEIRDSLVEYKLIAAVSNAVEHGLVAEGASEAQAELASGFATAATGALFLVYQNQKIGLAFIGEAGFRVLPALAKTVLPKGVPQESAALVLGVPSMYFASKMSVGPVKSFLQSTGISFFCVTFAGFVQLMQQKMQF
ncbi:MAG: hypothetical protein WCK49_01345 [Myxococcaceae bacterium]